MLEGHESNNNRNKIKAITILGIAIFIGIAFLILLRMKFIRDLFNASTEQLFFNFIQSIKIIISIFTGIASSSIIFYLFFRMYESIPFTIKTIENNKLLQKKKVFPYYRVTFFLTIKGIPRNTSKESNLEHSENPTLKYWDVISSIAKTCEDVSFWVLKKKNKVKLLFSVSGGRWLSKEKAKEKAKNNTMALKAAFRNRSPSIYFESSTPTELESLLEIIQKDKFGLTTSGIPMIKYYQTQIDRLINTFNSIQEDCYYITSFKGVKKGFERKNKQEILKRNKNTNDYEEDFIESQKSGQSKVGVYAFSETQNGIHMILAALLSIWAGTQTFNVKKLNGNEKRRIIRSLLQMRPIKKNRLSNKALSSFIHLPKEPYFTRDTGQPIFEIPTNQNTEENQKIVIGNIIQNERILDEFSLPLEAFLFNVEIIGMIGRGKTYFVTSIIEQLLEIDIGCLIFDLKGEYARLFINEPNVIVYTIGGYAPLGINLFEIESNDDIQITLALISEMLTIAGAPFSPTMQHIFEMALQKVAKLDSKNLETFLYCLNKSAEKYSTSMKTSYARDSIDAILNRLNYIFGGVNFEVFKALNNTINFDKLDHGTKIIIDFSEYLRRGANTASLFLVCNLILHLLSKHASRKGITNKLRYIVILEEAMYLIPKRFNLESSASIGYSEQNFIMGRSLGIGTVTIYQLWDSVSSVVHANSLTKILFRGEDIEKMRGVIKLTDEQFHFLAHLPDRYFILTSKSLSGPALLKSKTVIRKFTHRSTYEKTAQQKFLDNNIPYKYLRKSLIDLRSEIFLGEKLRTKRWEDSSIRDNIRNEKQLIGEFNGAIWEWCINICPTRLKFKEKHSDWIKYHVCYKMQTKAQKLVKELTEKEELSPLIEIINTKPLYLVNKIMNYYSLDSKKEEIEPLTFCSVNLLLHKLQKQFHFSNAWKNQSLNVIKRHIKSKAISDFSVQ